MPVGDKTDLDAAAKFDILNWVKTSGVPKVVAKVPEPLVSNEL